MVSASRWLNSKTREQRLASSGHQFYLNIPENSLAVILHEKGLAFSKRGYPDFTVYNSNGSIYGFVEVKPRDGRRLKEEQKKFHVFCFERDIPFLKWCPDAPTEEIQEFLKGIK